MESTLASINSPLFTYRDTHAVKVTTVLDADSNMAPKKQGQLQKATQKKLTRNSQTNQRVATPPPATTTNYSELQSNEVTALQAIYGEDFIEHTSTHSAWRKSEPTFDIRLKASLDEDITLILGVVLVATYPKSPPLLTLKSHNNLKDATIFKAQKFLETQPLILSKEEQEMIYSITEGLQEILEEAAEAKAAGKALPTLEEERAAHEAALVGSLRACAFLCVCSYAHETRSHTSTPSPELLLKCLPDIY